MYTYSELKYDVISFFFLPSCSFAGVKIFFVNGDYSFGFTITVLPLFVFYVGYWAIIVDISRKYDLPEEYASFFVGSGSWVDSYILPKTRGDWELYKIRVLIAFAFGILLFVSYCGGKIEQFWEKMSEDTEEKRNSVGQ